ncbi:MAG: OmpH family outer membrane protein [Porphyromonas sp.]|nr:OmpH family outer membrane protein [Porphyromonas sp.]
MKKIILTLAFLFVATGFSMAQKYALVDMEYILKNIPDYEMMNQQLEEVSKKWQSEIEALENKAQTLYKKYQGELVFLSAEQKKAREDEIVSIEKQAAELKRKYFGPEGELFNKRSDLMKPIQDEVWEVIRDLAKAKGYQMVLDRSTSGIVFANPAIDISADVLAKLGFSKK